MTEQNDYNIAQTSQDAPEAQPRLTSSTPPVNEIPSGDMQVKTPFEYLKDAFDKEVRSEPIVLEVPNRAGVGIEFDTNIDSGQIDMWRKQATLGNRRARRSGGEPEMDNVKFMSLVILAKAEIFVFDGQDVYLDAPVNNRPLNFKEDAALREIASSNSITDTELVRDIYRNDAHILSVGSQIVEAAGYGDDVAEMKEDPTVR